jgi:very-short-patch-repair endonuclease
LRRELPVAEIDWREWTPRLAGFYQALLRAQSSQGTTHLHNLGQALRYGLTADLGSFWDAQEDLLENERIVLKLDPESEEDEAVELELSALEEEDDGPNRNPAATEVGSPGPDPQAAATLRRIARKQRSDPYNRETLLGFPIICARLGRSRLSGPLLIWDVGVDYDPRSRELRLRRGSPIPDLNNVLIGKLAEDPDDIALVNEKVLPLLHNDDFGPNTIPEVLKAVTGIFTPLAKFCEVQGDQSTLRQLLDELNAMAQGDPALFSMRPILTNGPRSHAFLISDLEEIASRGRPEGDSVLSQIVGDVPKEGAPDRDPIRLSFDDTADGGNPLWFPFPSNRAQREVAQTAGAVKVLTVQGPPGTGKSQTIANLVCHLVTEGHSVLVTSHQRKAMEVLSKMLQDFGGLALSMLSGDKESLERLRTQLEGVQDRPPDHLTAESIERGEALLLEKDRELRRLARRFRELRRIEHEEFPKYSRYEDLREYDHLSPDDDPIEERASETAEHLREWTKLFHGLREGISVFESVFRPDGDQTSRVREAGIAKTIGKLIEAAESLERPVSPEGREIAGRLGRVGLEPEDRLALLESTTEWIAKSAPDLERSLRDLKERPEADGVLERWVDAVREVRHDRIRTWGERFDQLSRRFAESPIRGHEHDWASIDSRSHAIAVDVQVLFDRGQSFVWWYLSPDAYRVRRRLRDDGFEVRRSGRVIDLNNIMAALAWNELWLDAEREVREFWAHLPLPEGGRISSRSKEVALRVLARARTTVSMLDQAESVPSEDLELLFGDHFDFRALCTPDGRNGLVQDLSEARRWVLRRQLTAGLIEGLNLTQPWDRRVEAVAEAIQEGRLTHEAQEALDRFQRLSRNYPFYRRMMDLESVELARLGNSLRLLRNEIRQLGRVPEWIPHAEQALEAHRLSALVRASLSVHPDSLSEISAALEQGQRDRRKMISALIERKRILAIHRALQSPTTRVPLLELRKLLNRKRLNHSLLALRNRINYQAVLEVFPCWICTIDDAARLFPPQVGLFDYLIVDEASQCAQPTSLPLAFRSKQMIVVGDKKQLQPVTSLFLAGDTVRLLQQRYGIHEHPKATFLDGKESLLDLAEACSNASLFLDEHFRCDPAIIRWSNNRFYDNRLQILTRRRPDRARLPLEVKELKDADETPDKVNRQEAEAIVREIRRLIRSGEATAKTIGAISLFRPQADLIGLLLQREFRDDPELIQHHEIVASTADGFQGDERHIILYSFRYGPSSHAGSITTIQRSEERLNVAFTRAKDRGVCFTSVPPSEFPNGAVRDFLEHAKTEENRAQSWSVEGSWPDSFESQFEEAVCNRLRDRALRVTTQVPCGRYRIDLVVEDEEGRQLAVECDGDWKTDALGELRPEDYQRQDIIERAGWPVHRISGRRWLLNPEREMEKLFDALKRQPTRRAMQALQAPQEFKHDLIEDGTGPIAEVAESAAPAPDEAAAEPIQPFEREDMDHLTGKAALIRRLNRWVILRPQVEWSIVDRLYEMEQVLRGRIELMPEQEKFLEQALEWAVALGFDPEEGAEK